MAIMNKVKVTICGADYYLTTDEPVGTVQDAAARIDADMRNLLNADGRLSVLKAAVLVALNSATEICKAEQTADNLRGQMLQYLDDNARLRRENEQLRARLGLRPGAEPETASLFDSEE